MKKLYLLTLVLFFPAIVLSQQTGSGESEPNVLFIVADDLNTLLGSYGAEGVKTPNIDKLAREGRIFDRAYVQNPVCNPSRASYMTGRRPHQLGIQKLYKNFRNIFPDIVTLPQHFKNHGYHSAGIGKNYHNWGQQFKNGDPESWSEPEIYHWATHYHDWYIPGRPYQWHFDIDKGPAVQREDVPDEAYLDGRIANAAVNKLRELQETPFFLSVGFWKPHLPYTAPKKYWDLYDRDHLPAFPKYTEPVEGVPEIAYVNSNEGRSYTDVPNEGPISEAKKRELRHGYLAAISFLDAQVGKVLDELERLGMDKNTIVVFTSDHGYHAGEHGQFGKWTNFEIGSRVPLIIKTPGIPEPGKRSNSIVELVDLYPTLVELSGLPEPKEEEKLAGNSMVPILENPEATVKAAALSQTVRPIEGPDFEFLGSSIRTERFRYNIWTHRENHEIVAEELYDLSADLHNADNLIGRSGYEEIKNQLYENLMEMLDK